MTRCTRSSGNQTSFDRTKTPIFFRGILIAISVGVTVLAAEVYLRYSETYVVRQKADSWGEVIESDSDFLTINTQNGKRLIPNARVVIRNHLGSKRDIFLNINTAGFRGQEIPMEKKSDEIRILILGDSITLADYLQENETYVGQIEKYLHQWIKDRTIRVINGGVADIGLKEEIDILAEQGLAVRPDIIVIAFYLNDSRPPWGFLGESGRHGWLRRHSLLAAKIFEELEFSTWIQSKGKNRSRWIYGIRTLNWAHDKKAFLKLASMARYDWGSAWQTDSWKDIDQQLKRLKTLSKQHRFKVAVVAFPVVYQIKAKFVEDTPQKTVQKLVDRLGFRYLDLLPLLRAHRNEDLYLDHCHPGENANDMIGKAIAVFLKEKMLSNLN